MGLFDDVRESILSGGSSSPSFPVDASRYPGADYDGDGRITETEAERYARELANQSADTITSGGGSAVDAVADFSTGVADFAGDVSESATAWKYLIIFAPILVAAVALGQLFNVGVSDDDGGAAT